MRERGLPVWGSVGAAVRFVPAAWGGAWGALALAAAVQGGLLLTTEGGLQAGPWAAPLLTLAALALGLVVDGALYRLGVFGAAARREGLGFAGLQVGRPELRLLVAQVLISLFLVMIAIAAVVLLAVALTAAGLGEVDLRKVKSLAELQALAGTGPLVVVGLLVFGAAAVFLLLSVRFSLYAAATVGRRKVVSLNALGLAEGRFWPLLTGLVLVSLPSIGLYAWKALQPPSAAQLPLFAAVQAVTYAFVQKPLVAGFLSAAYRRLEYLPAEPGGE